MIDYSIISNSTDFYEDKGFKRIESPWTVTKAVSDITRPPSAKEFRLDHEDHKVLVASGEQSFLYLYVKGFLPLGKFQTVTPCFRHDSFDSLHTKYFVKNELIQTDGPNIENLVKVIADAKAFFSLYLPAEFLHVLDTQAETNTTSFDIVYRGDELGSYGIRKCDYLQWIYGTGVAEPRLSQIIKKYGLPYKRN